jgi:uncharacterized protein YecE (DUF72 family)
VTRVRIGCSGWNYRGWREVLYPRGEPPRRWLGIYAEHFDTVEVNATFYRLPAADTVRRWSEETPDDFRFAIKASRYLTHVRRLKDVSDGMGRLQSRLEPMAAAGRLGPILWQLPENFVRDDARLDAFLVAADRWRVRHTIEFRHPSWFSRPVLGALSDHGVALTIGDHPERTFQRHVATADWRYLRLHYGARGGNGRYSEAELVTWARRLGQWRRNGDIYAYFNNDWCGYAPDNATSLCRRLRVGGEVCDQAEPRVSPAGGR